MNNWSIKGEYLYFDLGSKRVVGLATNVDPPAYGYDMRNTGGTARFGINAKL